MGCCLWCWCMSASGGAAAVADALRGQWRWHPKCKERAVALPPTGFGTENAQRGRWRWLRKCTERAMALPPTGLGTESALRGQWRRRRRGGATAAHGRGCVRCCWLLLPVRPGPRWCQGVLPGTCRPAGCCSVSRCSCAGVVRRLVVAAPLVAVVVAVAGRCCGWVGVLVLLKVRSAPSCRALAAPSV